MKTDTAEPLTIPKAAKKLRCTPAALYAAMHRGDLRYVEKFGRLLVEVTELKRYRRTTKIGRPKNGNRKGAK